MRISERGQITIPKHLRDRFGLGHNVEVTITPTDEGLTHSETDGREVSRGAGLRHPRRRWEHRRLHRRDPGKVITAVDTGVLLELPNVSPPDAG